MRDDREAQPDEWARIIGKRAELRIPLLPSHRDYLVQEACAHAVASIRIRYDQRPHLGKVRPETSQLRATHDPRRSRRHQKPWNVQDHFTEGTRE